MQITETSNDGLKREFKVTIPERTFSSVSILASRSLAAALKLPGFRPGRCRCRC